MADGDGGDDGDIDCDGGSDANGDGYVNSGGNSDGNNDGNSGGNSDGNNYGSTDGALFKLTMECIKRLYQWFNILRDTLLDWIQLYGAWSRTHFGFIS